MWFISLCSLSPQAPFAFQSVDSSFHLSKHLQPLWEDKDDDVWFFFFFFGLFRATSKANGSSQAKGPMGAIAAGVRHSSRQHQILNLPRGARDQTHILMDTSQVHYHWATTGTPDVWNFNRSWTGKADLWLPGGVDEEWDVRGIWG